MKKIILTLFLLTCTNFINANGETKKEIQKHELAGKASYYGSEYKETRKTANGEHFNKNDYTAAHKTLPFGTLVKVTNKRNNKYVIVRVNDRGPFVKGRVIDITPIAANDLDMIKSGLTEVELEIIKKGHQ